MSLVGIEGHVSHRLFRATLVSSWACHPMFLSLKGKYLITLVHNNWPQSIFSADIFHKLDFRTTACIKNVAYRKGVWSLSLSTIIYNILFLTYDGSLLFKKCHSLTKASFPHSKLTTSQTFPVINLSVALVKSDNTHYSELLILNQLTKHIRTPNNQNDRRNQFHLLLLPPVHPSIPLKFCPPRIGTRKDNCS